MRLSDHPASHPSRRNFLALVQGIYGSSYKGIHLNFVKENLFYKGGCIPPVILPYKEEVREVAEWHSKIGDVNQAPPMNDDSYSRFNICLNVFRLNSPKLGEIYPDDLKILQDCEKDLVIADCGVIYVEY